MTKYIFLTIILSLSFTKTFAQNCNVTISPQDLTIDCGQSVDLYAQGLSANPALDTDFNNNSIGAGWSSSATVLYNNPCGPSIDGTSSAWFGEVPFPRTLTTNGFDMSCGGEICFDLDFADDDPCGLCDDCEDPDQANEGVFFQYSTDGGATWIDIFYFDPQASNDYYQWDTYCYSLPAGAQSANTMFQWAQPNATTQSNDHWGIDNVTIIPSGCGYWYDWDNIPGSPDGQGQTVSPGATTTYTVTYTDGTDVCTDDITVTVNSFDVVASATDVNLGCGGCTDLDVELTVPPAAGSVCQEVASVSGLDCDNFVAGIYSLDCVPAGNPIISIDMDGSVTGSFNCGDYSYTLIIDGTQISTGNCVVTDLDLTPYMPFTSVEIVSENEDFFCDNVTLDLVLDITYGSPNYVYSWTPTTDMTGANSQTPNVCPTATTTYTGTITETNTGCSASDAVTINITNGTLSLSCPAGLTAQCDISEQPAYTTFTDFQNAGGSATTTGTSNNVIPSTFTLISENSDNGSCPETVTRVYQIEDDCGNVEQCTQVITIEDTNPPVFAAAPADVTVACVGDVPAMTNLGWTDNCDGTGTVAGTDGALTGGSCGGTITRTWSYTDACGNPATATQTITVDDNIAPVFAAPPADVTVACVGDVPAMTNLGWTDNCDGTGTVAGTDGALTGGSCGGTITRTWSYTDACGNPATATQTITVDDNIAPVFAAPPADVTVACVGDVPAMTNLGWTDNCDGTGTVAGTDGALTGGSCGGTITRTWSYTDACGNPATATQTITVDDNIAPVFAAPPADVTVACVGDVPAMTNLGWTDNCDGTGTVAGTDGALTGGSCGGTITRTWTYTDACGNPATVTQTITVDDNIAPVFAAPPADVTVACVGDVPAMTNLGWTDNCDGTGTVAGTDGALTGGSCGGTITRTWSYTDACGNPATATQTITVDDNIAPVGTAPGPVTVQCAADVPVVNIADVTGVSDNCTVNPTVTHVGDATDGLSCPETITRTYEITDDCGNTTTVTQTITINDTQDPTASNPAPISATGSAPAPDITVVDDEADNCTVNPVVAFVGDVTDGLNCPETITRTYSVTDDCGNQIFVEQTITIGDAIIPTASNPDPISVQCSGDVPLPDETVVDDEADNGALPTVTWEDDTSDGLTCPETITRRYRVTDDCGNFIFVEQTITVNDDIDPTATAPADASYQCLTDVPVASAADITDEADNCTANPTVVYNGETTAGTCPMTITRTWDISDDCNNTITVTQIITVDDNVAPVGTAPGALAVQCAADVPVANIADVTGVSDNCTANPTVTHVGDATDGLSCPETITRTYEIEDDCGNITTLTQTITINDDIDPLGTAPADLTVACVGDIPAVNIADVTGVSDNCTALPIVTHVGDVNSGATCPFDVTRTYRIEDECGNFIEVDQVITVNDNVAPVGTAPAAVAVQCAADVPAADIADVTGVSDNCTANPTVTHIGDATDGLSCPETITRTYEIEDDCGNVTTLTQTITIDDDINPTATAPAPVAVQCIGDVPAIDETVITDEADNCSVPIVTHVGDATDGLSCPETITRTYRIEDACGNFIEVDQIITVNDDIAPTASNALPTTVECATDVPAVDPAVITDEADNCTAAPTVTFISEVSDGNVCNGEQITRTYEVADDCGNTITVTHTITIDSYTPTFTVAGTDPTVCGGTDGFITISGLDPNTDYLFEYNGNAQITITTDASGEYVVNGLGSGSYTGFTVSDVDCPACSTTDGVTITLTDPNPPAIDAGLDQQVCDGDQVTLTANNPDGANITWDNGITDGVAFTPAVGTTTYTVTADLAGCINSDVVQVTVAPTIDALTCPGGLTAVCDITEQPAYADFYAFIADGGSATIPAGGEIDTASFVLLSEVSDGLTCPETVTRTYQIADTCGVTVTCTQTIVINDLIDPTGTAPAPIAVQCIGDVPLPDETLITDEADNCGVPTVTHVGDASDGLTCPETITRTYRIEDACGNFIEVDQTITVNDDTDPTATAPAPVAVQCIGDVPAIDETVITDEADNCSVPTVTHVGDVTDGLSCPETITRTYRIEDACGNFIEVDQIITVNDDIAPTASNAAPTTVECATDVPAVDETVITDEADNCTANPTVTFISEVSDNNVCNGEQIVRTYEVADDCGNTTTVTHTITIDSYTPTFTVAGTDPTTCGGTDGFITISGLDPNTDYLFEYNGNAQITITTDAAGEYAVTGLGAGSYTSFTVSDADCPACSTTDGVTITLVDPNPPAIDAGLDQQVCEGDQVTLTANNPDGANITWDNGITDGTAFTPAVGTTTYTVTADLAGCISSDVVDVTVAPTIDALTCPGGLTAVCDITEQPAYADFYAFIADGGSATIPAGGEIDTASFVMLSEVSDGLTCPETVTRTYQIADTCGVTVTCTQTIVINDLIDPTGTAPAPIAVQCIGDVPLPDETLITDEADNCSVPTVTHVGDASDGNTCPETITRTYRIEDACGNFIEVDQIITVNDDIDPLATAPAPVAVQCIGDVPLEDIADVTGVSDNCTANPTVTFVGDASDGNTCPETITRTYRIEDACGNFIEVDQIITVNDDIAPTASNPVTTTVACATDVPAADITVVTDEADNCTATPTVTFISETSDNNVCNGEQITRTYEIADDCGNTTTVAHTIIIDSYTPIFTVVGTDPTTCGGSDGFITITGLDPNTTYEFTYNGNPAQTFTTDANGVYVLTGLTAGSYTSFTVAPSTCKLCEAADGTIVNLVDPNAPSLEAGPDQEVCDGIDVALTADNPDGANISWDNGVTDGVPFTPAVGTTNYTVTAELNGCISTDVVTVLVNPLPNVNAGNDVSICEGEPVTLSGSGADTYIWDNGVTNGVSFVPLATTTYTVTGTSADGCVNTDDVVITVNANPSVVFEADIREGCVPLTVNFSNLTAGNSAGCIYTFSDGSQLTGCDPTHTFTSPGCYDISLQVTNADGCVNTTTLQDYICVDDYPVAEFTVNPDELTNLDNTAQFTNGSFGASTYDWQFGDGGSSTDVNPEHSYPEDEDGNYEVQLIAYSDLGCPDTVTTILPLREELIYYVPNTFTPDGNKLNNIFKPVFTSGFDPQDYTLLIFNRWGELIFESNNPQEGWDGRYTSEGDEVVKDGTYVWKIIFSTKYNDERIVKVGHVNVLK